MENYLNDRYIITAQPAKWLFIMKGDIFGIKGVSTYFCTPKNRGFGIGNWELGIRNGDQILPRTFLFLISYFSFLISHLH